MDAKRNLSYCSVCGHITDQDPCYICQDQIKRSSYDLCSPRPERCHCNGKNEGFQWTISCFAWAISPMDGIGPEDINVPILLKRLQDETVEELILATNPNIEGEATAMYISRLRKTIRY